MCGHIQPQHQRFYVFLTVLYDTLANSWSRLTINFFSITNTIAVINSVLLNYGRKLIMKKLTPVQVKMRNLSLSTALFFAAYTVSPLIWADDCIPDCDSTYTTCLNDNKCDTTLSWPCRQCDHDQIKCMAACAKNAESKIKDA